MSHLSFAPEFIPSWRASLNQSVVVIVKLGAAWPRALRGLRAVLDAPALPEQRFRGSATLRSTVTPSRFQAAHGLVQRRGRRNTIRRWRRFTEPCTWTVMVSISTKLWTRETAITERPVPAAAFRLAAARSRLLPGMIRVWPERFRVSRPWPVLKEHTDAFTLQDDTANGGQRDGDGVSQLG